MPESRRKTAVVEGFLTEASVDQRGTFLLFKTARLPLTETVRVPAGSVSGASRLAVQTGVILGWLVYHIAANHLEELGGEKKPREKVWFGEVIVWLMASDWPVFKRFVAVEGRRWKGRKIIRKREKGVGFICSLSLSQSSLSNSKPLWDLFLSLSISAI